MGPGTACCAQTARAAAAACLRCHGIHAAAQGAHGNDVLLPEGVRGLSNIASTIRGRFVFKGKVRALTAEVRTSAFILGALPFVVAGSLMILRPGYLVPLMTEPSGRTMLLVCGLLFGSGVLLMRSLSQVEA